MIAGIGARFIYPQQVDSPKDIALAVMGSYNSDLGEITQGAKLTQTVRVENRGGRRLFIEPLETSCSCAQSKSIEIPPGGSEEIQIEFKTEGLSGFKQFRTRFQTSAPNLPEFEIQSRVIITAGPESKGAPSPEPLIF